MAAANFSKDVLEMFYGSQDVQQRLSRPIRATRRFDFELARNNFGGNRDLLKYFQKTKNRFIEVCENEVRTLKNVKIQFSLLVSFSWNQGEVQQMEHYFNRMSYHYVYGWRTA